MSDLVVKHSSIILVVDARFLTQNITGVQRYSIELSLQIRKRLGNAALFVTPRGIRHSDIARQLGAVTIGTRSGHVWEQWDLPNYLRKIGTPLLLCMGNAAPILYKNKIITLHDVTFLRYPDTFSNKFRWFYKALVPCVLCSSKHIFTVSHFSLKEIAAVYGVDKQKMSVLYNAVSSIFKPIVDQRLQDEKYVLVVSSVKENKNFMVAVDAFNMARQQYSDLLLYIVGDMETESFRNMRVLVDEWQKSPYIRLLGRISDSDLARYYSNAAAFIFPSLYEGFGIPAIEAQACGCPVISSNASSLPEVLGDSALMCDPHHASEFADAIVRLVSQPALKEKLISKGYENVKRFSYEKSADDLLKYIHAFVENTIR